MAKSPAGCYPSGFFCACLQSIVLSHSVCFQNDLLMLAPSRFTSDS